MDTKYSRVSLQILIGVSLLMGVILLTLTAQKSLDNPQTCNLCHEMKPYVMSYLKPEGGSAIAKHKFGCLACHTNSSTGEARSAVMREMEASAFNRLTGIQLNTTLSPLAVNCTRCHQMSDILHVNASMNTSCKDCHWAHRPPAETKKIDTTIIPYGPHKNQSCRNCHGTTFEIPRCTKCHAGHGGQKLENNLCLGCHIDPHLPKKPGILPNNTVKFTGVLPFSACKPCHENEYYEVTGSISKHINMQTCTKCHEYHGEKPRCNKCHPVMQKEQHPDFACGNCHKSLSEIKVTCQDCHGNRVHDITASEAQWNPR